jgi:predicted DNA binding CopG/RHH family protein
MLGKEGKYLAHGKTRAGRFLLVVWASRSRRTKIITARDMTKEKKMKVPKFKSPKEEREFWDTHDSMDYLDDFEVATDVVFVRPKKEVISLRLDPGTVKKIRELADNEGLPPTTYVRMLIIKGIRDRTANP